MPKVTKTNEVESDNQFDLQSSAKRRGNLFPWALLIIVLLAAGAFVFIQHRKEKTLQNQISDLKQNPQKATEEETKALLDKVGQLIELPNEQPTVATVTDLAPLKDQPFFANAQIGDKVLIFSQAKKAVLYRPSTNKVIEVAPVNLDNPPANVNTNKATSTTDTNTNTANKNANTNTTKSKTTNTNTK
jgi:hypothetical protein